MDLQHSKDLAADQFVARWSKYVSSMSNCTNLPLYKRSYVEGGDVGPGRAEGEAEQLNKSSTVGIC